VRSGLECANGCDDGQWDSRNAEDAITRLGILTLRLFGKLKLDWRNKLEFTSQPEASARDNKALGTRCKSFLTDVSGWDCRKRTTSKVRSRLGM
jgi:hypothetical protein